MRAGRAALVLAALLAGGAARAGAPAVHALAPAVEPARAGTQCVADPAFMRRNHMGLMKHQRDDTVRGGIRGADARFSLRACVDCHASTKTASVNAAPTDFCVSCHRYAAVRIDCFDCHTGKAAATVAAGGGAR